MASLDERGFVADGEVVWSWHPDAGVKFRGSFPRGDGGKRAGHRGERGVTVKTNAQGMSGCFGVPVVTTLVRFVCCARGCGCIVHPAFPAPSILSRDIVLQSSGAIRVAGRRRRVRTTRF